MKIYFTTWYQTDPFPIGGELKKSSYNIVLEELSYGLVELIFSQRYFKRCYKCLSSF